MALISPPHLIPASLFCRAAAVYPEPRHENRQEKEKQKRGKSLFACGGVLTVLMVAMVLWTWGGGNTPSSVRWQGMYIQSAPLWEQQDGGRGQGIDLHGRLLSNRVGPIRGWGRGCTDPLTRSWKGSKGLLNRAGVWFQKHFPWLQQAAPFRAKPTSFAHVLASHDSPLTITSG
jgi:hypothetical protein